MKTTKFCTMLFLFVFVCAVVFFALNSLPTQGANPVADGISAVTQTTNAPAPVNFVAENPATPFEVLGESTPNQEHESGDEDGDGDHDGEDDPGCTTCCDEE